MQKEWLRKWSHLSYAFSGSTMVIHLKDLGLSLPNSLANVSIMLQPLQNERTPINYW